MSGSGSLPRRRLVAGLGAALPLCLLGRAVRAVPAGPAALDPREWAAFKALFLAPEGRIVDTGNGGISHSEGQGWGLLLAEAHDDRATFDALLGWTTRHLQRRGDALSSWRYQPGATVPVQDPNNATDGDLFIAWALLRASARWGSAAYRTQGTAVARDIRRLLVRQVGGRTVLLPGAVGFERPEGVVLNPSYYAFGAIRALGVALPDPAWGRLEADGIALLRAARFGRWGLPPDWLAFSPRATPGAELQPAQGWPRRFSFDAVRVPLYLSWARLSGEPAVAGAAAFWSDGAHPFLPAWADLSAAGQVAPYPAPPGVVAIADLAQGRGGRMPAAGLGPSPSYYSAALAMLSRLAAVETAWG